MLKAISELYQTPDLTGAALTRPLQKYHQFFKINNPFSDGLTRGAWLAANIFTGIVIYPAFGIVAGVGMVVKLCGIPALKAHNRKPLLQIEVARVEYQEGRVYHERGNNALNAPKGYDYIGFSFKADLDNYMQSLNGASARIRAHTSEFRRVALQIVTTQKGNGEAVYSTFKICTLEPARPAPAYNDSVHASV